MITPEELGILEKRIQHEEQRLRKRSKILSEVIQGIQDSRNFSGNKLDNWSDYNAWDNWDRGG